MWHQRGGHEVPRKGPERDVLHCRRWFLLRFSNSLAADLAVDETDTPYLVRDGQTRLMGKGYRRGNSSPSSSRYSRYLYVPSGEETSQRVLYPFAAWYMVYGLYRSKAYTNVFFFSFFFFSLFFYSLLRQIGTVPPAIPLPRNLSYCVWQKATVGT